MRFVLFLDFQFMSMVFLAIVKATRSNLVWSGVFRFVIDVSQSRQSVGDKGMWQPMKAESEFVTLFQNCCTGVQCHIVWM